MGGTYAASLCWGGITGGSLSIQPGGLLFASVGGIIRTRF